MACVPILQYEEPRPARRLGRFHVSRCLLENWADGAILALFSNFVVVRAEVRYEFDSIEYLAFSELFEEVEQGIVPPLYEIQCHREFVAGLSPVFSFTASKSQIQP